MKFSTTTLVLAQFVSTAGKFALFILLMQFGGFETAGSYTYALSVVTPIFILFGLSLRQIYVTSPSEPKFGHYLFLRYLYGILGIIVVSLTAMLIQPEMLALFTVMGIYRFVETLIDMRIASFQRSSRVDLMAASVFLQAVLMTGAVAVTFSLTDDLVLSVIVGLIAGLFLQLVLRNLDPNKSGRNRLVVPPRTEIIKISKKGILLSLSAFAVSLGTSVPVLVLGSTHNTAAVGVYSSIYHLQSVSNVLFSAVTQAELRSLAKLAAEGRYSKFIQHGRRFSWMLALVGVLGTIILYFFGTEVFSFIFGQDFTGYTTALLLMGLTICLSPFSFFLDAQLTALQKFGPQTIISFVMLVLTVALSLVLVPDFQVVGATLVILITMMARNTVKRIVVGYIIRNSS